MPTITDQRAGPKRKEGIQWTDASCNPFKLELPDGKRVNACVKISEGCRNCYSETMTNHWWPRSETEAGRTFPGFSLPLLQRGKPWLDTELLRKLLRWKPKPPFKSPDGRPKVFAFDMTDFFLDLWPDDFLDQFMAVVAIRQDIDFQILTKRAERMHRYFTTGRGPVTRQMCIDRAAAEMIGGDPLNGPPWPLPNLFLGVSAEDQARADERIPILLRTPAAVRFVSYEPAIGPLDFTKIRNAGGESTFPSINALRRWTNGSDTTGLDWIIVGGESGKARPFNIEWARRTIEQCRAAKVACFVKQCGGNIRATYYEPDDRARERMLDRKHRIIVPTPGGEYEHNIDTDFQPPPLAQLSFRYDDSHGGDPSEWPEDIRVREWPRSR